MGEAEHQWGLMHEGNKKNMIDMLQNFKKSKELGDEEGAMDSLQELEKIGRLAKESGDESTHKLIPHLIAELEKLEFVPLEKTEGEEEKDEAILEEEEYDRYVTEF